MLTSNWLLIRFYKTYVFYCLHQDYIAIDNLFYSNHKSNLPCEVFIWKILSIYLYIQSCFYLLLLVTEYDLLIDFGENQYIIRVLF